MKRGNFIVKVLFVLIAVFAIQAKEISSPGYATFVTPNENPQIRNIVDELREAKRVGNCDAVIRLENELSRILGLNRETDNSGFTGIQTQFRLLPHTEARFRPTSFDVDLRIPQTAGSAKEASPWISSTRSGTLFAVYEEYDGVYSPEPYLVIVRSDDFGRSWSSFATIYNSSVKYQMPKIIIGEGVQNWIFVAYEKVPTGLFSSTTIEVAKIALDGSSYEFHEIDGSAFSSKVRPFITIDTDSYYYVYVSYIRNGMFGSEVCFARSTDFGSNWTIIDASPDNQGKAFTSLAYGKNGELYLVTQTADETGQIWFNKSTNYGATWGTPVTISTTHKDTYPMVSASHTSDDIIVSYIYQYSSSDRDIYYSISTTNGASWSTSHPAAVSTREEKHAVVAVDNTSFYLLYWDAGRIKMKKMPLGTTTFVETMDVSDDAMAADNFIGLSITFQRDFPTPIAIWSKAITSTNWDIYFDMNPCTPPIASASITPTSGAAPLTVTFTDNSRGTITRREWDLGDGTRETSASFTHTYTRPGRYRVTLTVSSFCGTNTASYSIDVGCGTLRAAINADVTSGIAPLTVHFSDGSTGSPVSWLWDFGDGTTSTDQNPTHTYTSIGSYNVTLRVTDECGASSTAYIGIEVTPAPTPIAVINPSSLSFDTVAVGDRASLDLIISNRGTGPLTVNWSSTISEGFYIYGATGYSIPPDSFVTVQLFFAPTAERPYTSVFTIITNDPFRPTISVPLSGYGTMRTGTGVYISPSIVNFDSVAVGSAARQRLTLRNNSSDVVRVTRYEMRGRGFSILTDDTISVVPGGYRFLTVEFLPTAAVAYFETLFVYTTAGNFSVLLSGTGYFRFTCYTLGAMKLCAEIIGDGRAERNITFRDLDDNIILTVSGPVAFIDLARMAGTGIGYFHYADGSSEMCFIGGFDIDRINGRIITHFSIDTTIYDDSLLGAPFRAGVGVSPVTVDIPEHWWRLAGGIGISRGGVSGEIRIARVRDWYRHDHYELSDFDLEILGGAFTVRFVDLHVHGDTIEAGRLYLRAREDLVPGLSGRSFFEIDARSLRIYHGTLVRLDLHLQFPDFSIPAGGGQVINIRRPRLRFEFRDIDGDGAADLYGVGGGGIFAYRNLLPSLGSDTYINIWIMIRREGLDDAVLGFHGFSPGIPLGTSGFFITGVEGEVRHICHPENIIVRFSCDLRGGPSLPLVGGIVEMTPTVTIDFEHDLLALEGTVRFLRGLTSGRGGFIFMARDIGGGFGMRGYASVTAGLSSFASLEGGINAHIWRDSDDAQFHFTGTGYVEVVIRSRVIFWLMPTDDLRVGAYAYFGEFRHGGDSGGHWGVKGELAWRPFGIAPSIAWIDGTFIMDAHEYRLVDTRRRIKDTEAFEISNCVIGNTDINTFVIRTASTEHPRLSLVTPTGDLITPERASTTDSLAPIFYAENVSGEYRYCGYVVHGRNPGTWQIQIEGLSSGDVDHPVQVKGFYNPLVLAINSTYDDGRVTVRGNLSNLSGRAEKAWINIFIARRTSSTFKGDGTLIQSIETRSDGSFTYSFTQEEIGARGGEYYVYATAEDNLNRFASAVDSVNIIRFPEDRIPPLPPVDPVAVVKDSEVVVKWDRSPSVDVVGYKVYRGEFIDSLGAYVWDEVVDIGDLTYYTIFNTSMMIRDIRKLAVAVKAYDNSGNESEITYATILGRSGEADHTAPTVTLETPAYDLEQGILMVFWNTSDTDIRGFILEIGLDEENIYERIELPAETRYYTFEKLRQGLDYYVRLRAYDNYLNISEPASMSIPFYYENDMDGDGLPDWWERYHFTTIALYNGTDDPDNDLVSNAYEYEHGTSPLSWDTDNDRISDYIEITTEGLNPVIARDNDGDGIPDDWERYYFGEYWDPKRLPFMDNDGDNVINLTEYTLGTNPLNRDTDGGGVFDGDELIYGTDPRNPRDDFYPAFTIRLRRGWNLISLPVRAYENTTSKVFPLSLGTYIYNPTTRRYETPISIEPGKAYFVLSLVDTSYTILSMPVESYTIPINAGWNMIGSVYSRSIDLSELSTAPGGIIIPNSLYRYETGTVYRRTTSIEPGVGYWILSINNGTLTVSSDGSSRKKNLTYSDAVELAYNIYGQLPPLPPSEYTYTKPERYELFQNRPNPFNSSTVIEFALPEKSFVKLSIYNMLGENVRTLIFDELNAGFHRISWDAKDNNNNEIPSGIYLYKLETPKITITKQMLLLK